MDAERFEHKLRTTGIFLDKVSGGDAQNLKPRHLFMNDEFIYWTETSTSERDPIRSLLLVDILSVTEGYVHYSEYITIENSNPRRPKVIFYVKDKENFEHLFSVLSAVHSKNKIAMSQKVQVEQYDMLETCLGYQWFHKHPSPLIRATRGLVFLREMSVSQLLAESRALRKQAENA